MHAVLRSEVEQLDPRPGDRIAIKRLSDSNKQYRRFKVIVDRAEPAKDEKADVGEADAQPEPPTDTES